MKSLLNATAPLESESGLDKLKTLIQLSERKSHPLIALAPQIVQKTIIFLIYRIFSAKGFYYGDMQNFFCKMSLLWGYAEKMIP